MRNDAYTAYPSTQAGFINFYLTTDRTDGSGQQLLQRWNPDLRLEVNRCRAAIHVERHRYMLVRHHPVAVNSRE